MTWSRATSAFAWKMYTIARRAALHRQLAGRHPGPWRRRVAELSGALPGAATAGQPEPPRARRSRLLPGQTYRHQTRYRLIPTDNSPLSRLPSPIGVGSLPPTNIISWFSLTSHDPQDQGSRRVIPSCSTSVAYHRGLDANRASLSDSATREPFVTEHQLLPFLLCHRENQLIKLANQNKLCRGS